MLRPVTWRAVFTCVIACAFFPTESFAIQKIDWKVFENIENIIKFEPYVPNVVFKIPDAAENVIDVKELTFEADPELSCDVEKATCEIKIKLTLPEQGFVSAVADANSYDIEFFDFGEDVAAKKASSVAMDKQDLILAFSAEDIQKLEIPEAANLVVSAVKQDIVSAGVMLKGTIYKTKAAPFTPDILTPDISTDERVVNMNDGGACAVNTFSGPASASMWPYFLTTLLGLFAFKKRRN